MEGEVILESPIPTDWQDRLPGVVERFMGETTQIPSMFSALKHEGKPLYEYARAGITIEREPRTIHIFEMKVLDLSETTFSLEIRCSKGTYIRTLIEDMAIALGTCGVVRALARTAVGPYGAHEMVTLATLEEAEKAEGFQGVMKYLQPLESALTLWPAVELNSVAMHYIRQGQAIRVPMLPESGLVRILGVGRRFLGIGEVLGDGRVAPKRLISETSEVN
jgi:tRNA pseudouridine55 synthase